MKFNDVFLISSEPRKYPFFTGVAGWRVQEGDYEA